MIYTVTVNPALDVTNQCGEPVTPTTIRPDRQQRHAGGKGIDVSRVIRNLGGTSVAMGFLGGFTGRQVEGLLLAEGLQLDFVYVNEETRTNVIIIAPDVGRSGDKLVYRFNSAGPEVQPFESRELYEKIRKLRNVDATKRPTLVAICGSLSGKRPKWTFYVNIIRYFKEMGATVALDTSGLALKESMRYPPRPDLIKPNIDELNALLDDALISGAAEQHPVYKEKGKEEYLNQMASAECGVGNEGCEFWHLLLREGKRLMGEVYRDLNATMVTLGPGGILLMLSEQNKVLHAKLTVPLRPAEVKSTVGAGDAALAALVWAREQGKSWDEALQWAAATGSVAVTMEGTEAPSGGEVRSFLERIEVHNHSWDGERRE